MLANERVALVVGNAAYEHAPPLANPKNDAEDMAALLRRLGFQVTAGLDLTDAALEDRVRAFSRQARAAQVALFFYAGHGLQVDGDNYLVPVDAHLADEADLPFEALQLDLVLKRMGGGTNLVFLDACRDNPFARGWEGAGRSTAVGRGLRRVGEASGSGLFIAFATDPDRIAADGEGRNSPFTAALKRHIETPGLEINGLLTEVRKTVLASTGNIQRPWSNSSLSDAFYFVPGAAPPASRVGASRLNVDADALQDTVFWESVKDSGEASGFEAYLEQYPDGAFAPLAVNRLRALVWAPIENSRDPMAFENYLAASPNGRFAGDARGRLEAWVRQADKSALDRYLSKHPKGAVADAAKQRLPAASWEAIRSSGDFMAFWRYLEQYPGGAHSVQARRRLRQALRQSRNEAALSAFARRHPNSEFAGEAWQRAAALAWEGAKDSLSPEEFDNLAKRHPGTEAAKLAILRRDELLNLRDAFQAKWPAGKRFRDCSRCPEMVVVPSGSFLMGSPESEAGAYDNERPVHRVTVQSFAAGVYEVRFAEWDACVAGGGCGGHRPDDMGWGRGRRPVANVSWDDAQLYVAWLSRRAGHRYRLLSESEWEYAARAGTTGPFHTGETISTKQANYDGNYAYGDGFSGVYRNRTVPVGSFPPNAFGLYDVHGNVWEWVQDCWNGGYQGAPSDGGAWESGDCSNRVLRGGAWNNAPWNLRSAGRYGNYSGDRNDFVGFRVARTLTP